MKCSTCKKMKSIFQKTYWKLPSLEIHMPRTQQDILGYSVLWNHSSPCTAPPLLFFQPQMKEEAQLWSQVPQSSSKTLW